MDTPSAARPMSSPASAAPRASRSGPSAAGAVARAAVAGAAGVPPSAPPDSPPAFWRGTPAATRVVGAGLSDPGAPIQRATLPSE